LHGGIKMLRLGCNREPPSGRKLEGAAMMTNENPRGAAGARVAELQNRRTNYKPKAPTDPVSGFRQAMRDAGLEPPDVIEPGKLHRFPGVGKRNGNTAGWCKLFPDGLGGVFGDWAAGFSKTWQAKRDKPLAPAEREAFRRQVEDARARAEMECKVQQDDAARRASELWLKASRVKRHPYLAAKKVSAHGIRQSGDSLLIPLFDADDALHSLQFIGPDGTKKFLPGGRVTGCFHLIGEPQGAGALLVCEGYATGASLHEATGMPVVVAFSAGNLKPVSLALRATYPGVRLIICADNDAKTEGNPGLEKATEAALAVDGLLAVPPVPGDFNDYCLSEGPEAVARSVANATTPACGEHQPGDDDAPAGDSEGNGWPEPQPLTAKIEPEEYPLDALPDTIRAAVEEVQAFVQAPIPLVASSALAALSLACQAHIDVKRAEKLQGPANLFLLTIADSGERKSTSDAFLTAPIREWEKAQAEAAKPALREYEAALASWEAEREGIIAALREAGRKGKPTDHLRRDLAQHQQSKPEPPRIPRLLYVDATPEALAYGLTRWPAAGVVSAEGGAVFGAHAMSKDSVMRNLALLNQLWDGASLTVDRRTSESFRVCGARLTLALQVQEATLREFLTKTGPLARKSGFLARFLVSWPQSTQGTRFFKEAPQHWPHLEAFHRRIAEILAQPVPIDEDGALAPVTLTLTPAAKAAWVEFHDAIERELAAGGELYDVRDAASKTADNAARVAALFQVFEHGIGAVGDDAIERASRITAWHLSEARRFFGELALPAELADAARLDSWLIEYCKRERTHLVPTREAQRLGPIRDKEKLATALRELEELDRVRVTHEGRRKTIKVNPALVGVTP
jgi:putative DNA primase/helicase